MSWVFIDTTVSGTFRFGLLEKEGAGIVTEQGRSNALLSFMEQRIGEQGLHEASGICVVRGPGSFSAVRSGVLIANILSRCLRKPLVGVFKNEANDLGTLEHRLATGDVSSQESVMPIYDAEPNITKKVTPLVQLKKS